MRRVFACVLVVMTLLLSGCQQNQPKAENSVAFYYQRDVTIFGYDDSVIACELREWGESKEDLPRLLEQYLAGPRAPELKNVFPQACKLISVSVSEDTAMVCLDASFAELEGMKLTIACACLTKTVMEQTGVTSVQISAKDALLAGAQQITMHRENVLLIDQSAAQTENG